MECDQCRARISENLMCEHLGRKLCEECYMDVLSPVKTCDPWAAFNAKSFEGEPVKLCETQEQILDVLKTKGPLSPDQLLAALSGDWTYGTLEREFATLKRLEKIRAVREEGQILLRLW